MMRTVISAAVFCGVLAVYCSQAFAFTDDDQDWQEWSDQSFAPPGWNCWWQHELDNGDCEPLPGWTLVFDPVLRDNILVRTEPRELYEFDVRIARAWDSFSPKTQYLIKAGGHVGQC